MSGRALHLKTNLGVVKFIRRTLFLLLWLEEICPKRVGRMRRKKSV